MTLSTAPIASAERIALPRPFKWPGVGGKPQALPQPVYIV